MRNEILKKLENLHFLYLLNSLLPFSKFSQPFLCLRLLDMKKKKQTYLSDGDASRLGFLDSGLQHFKIAVIKCLSLSKHEGVAGK